MGVRTLLLDNVGRSNIDVHSYPAAWPPQYVHLDRQGAFTDHCCPFLAKSWLVRTFLSRARMTLLTLAL